MVLRASNKFTLRLQSQAELIFCINIVTGLIEAAKSILRSLLSCTNSVIKWSASGDLSPRLIAFLKSYGTKAKGENIPLQNLG